MMMDLTRKTKEDTINESDIYETPDFSVGTLEALIEAGHEVVLAVTQPDKPKDAEKEMQFTPVKECALKHGIPVYQPRKVREPGVCGRTSKI